MTGVVRYLMTAEIKKIVILFLECVDNLFVLFRDLLDALDA